MIQKRKEIAQVLMFLKVNIIYILSVVFLCNVYNLYYILKKIRYHYEINKKKT
jgi:hypothetical protein